MVDTVDILLVNPACLDDRINPEDAGVIPIGLYYIAALLIENGYDTSIINLADLSEDPVFVFSQTVAKTKPDVIGFSITNPTRWCAIECAAAAKQLKGDTTIVFGGPAATFMPEHLFDACPALDIIVPGEGEYPFLDLVNAVTGTPVPLEQIDGLIFKKNGRLVKTRRRASVENLDSLVHPSKYFTYQHLAMSRGCPGFCTFCGSPKFWGSRQVRAHSPQWFADEIIRLAEKGITHFYISDDTFTADKERVLAFCRIIRDTGLKITWNAISRVDAVDEQILAKMRTAGCIQISYGVESGSRTIRKTLGKPTPDERIIRAFELTRFYGILPRAYFIYGSPGETRETIQDSVRLMDRIKPLSAVFYMLVVFPGTHLYQTAVQKKKINEDIWHQKIEDLPWFEVDDSLDFKQVKQFGDLLRNSFYNRITAFAETIKLIDDKTFYPYHADFLSRLAMTFSHGEYAEDSRIETSFNAAKVLFERSLAYAPNVRGYLGYAMLLQKMRQFDNAIKILEKGLALWPGQTDLCICKGVCLMNAGQFQNALLVFKELDHLPETHHYIHICQQQLAGPT